MKFSPLVLCAILVLLATLACKKPREGKFRIHGLGWPGTEFKNHYQWFFLHPEGVTNENKLKTSEASLCVLCTITVGELTQKPLIAPLPIAPLREKKVPVQ